MPISAPQIIDRTAAQKTAFIHLTVPRSEIRNVMGPGLQELRATVEAQGIAVTGAWFTHHLRIDPEIFDFRISLPVASKVEAAGRVEAGELPPRTVAQTIYTGPYEGLGSAWGEFTAWIEGQGHKAAADIWECYVSGPESSPEPGNWHTELNCPLAFVATTQA